MDNINKIKNTASYIAIGFIYNILFHKIGNVMYTDLDSKERKQHIITMIFMSGILGIVLGTMLISDDFEYKNSIVGNGLRIGGIFLIFSSIANNWSGMGDHVKVGLLSCILVVLIKKSYDSQ